MQMYSQVIMLTIIIVEISWAMDAVTQGTYTEHFSCDHFKYTFMKQNQNKEA